jgi:hypothetical protein
LDHGEIFFGPIQSNNRGLMSNKKTNETDLLMIKYESAFTNEFVRNSFLGFLKTEHNQNTFECLVEISNIKEISDDTKAFEKVNHILNTYIYDDSPSEINISFQVKEKLFKTFEKQKEEKNWILEVKPQNLFEETEKVIQLMLYHDSWKRFTRSKFANEIYEKYSKDVSVCSPKVSQQFSYEDEYFKHPFIEDKDFDFARTLFEDGKNWEVF